MTSIPVKNRLLTAAEMARVDAHAIEKLGIPGIVLMEQAGRAVADRCRAWLPAPNRVVVLCGPGNNGGDGFVVARRLLETGATIQVFALGDKAKIKGDARTNLEIWQRLGQTIEPFGDGALTAISAADLVVDAMLGTGARGSLRGDFRTATQAINRSDAVVVAVDLPTGLDADSGTIDPDTVRADETVTFGARKIGLLFHPGKSCTGTLTVADIGFPTAAFDAVTNTTFVLDADFIAGLLPQREPTAFKNRCGQVLIVAGSAGMSGAAALTSKAALRAGAGLVVLGTPASVARHPGDDVDEIMRAPLPESDGHIGKDAWQALHDRLAWATVVAAGPGLGTSAYTQELVHRLVADYHGILVLDADAVNVLAGQGKLLEQRKQPALLTPHPGEFQRLSGYEKEEIASAPVEVARRFASTHGVHLLLKGAPSVAALPDGRVFVNGAGNPGMATAGMGDVLTGVLAGLAGQVEALKDALLAGMFVHSLAGDLAREAFGEIAMTAGDVLALLPDAFLQLMPSTQEPHA